MPKQPPKAAKAKMGRPPVITPEMIKTISTAVRSGLPVGVAAAMVGIERSTYYAWLSPKHPNFNKDFSDAIKKAAAEGEFMLVGTIARASGRAWQAAAWMLERQQNYRTRWAKASEISPRTA